MDYGKVLGRAWQITWRWKALWILGFLASLGSGGGAGSNSYYSSSSNEWNEQVGNLLAPEVWAAIAGLACLLLIVFIVLWVISVIARGGLIAGVQQVEIEGSTTFLQAWRAGKSRFWTLVGIGVLAALPLIVLALLGMFVLGLTIFAGVSAGLDAGSPSGVGAIIVPLFCCGGVAFCGLGVVAIILGQIRLYAERAAVLEGLSWIEAFQRGWEVLKDNVGPTLVLWVIFFALGMAVAFVIFMVMLVALAPMILLVSSSDPGAWVAAPICCGGLLAVLAFSLIGAIVGTFSSATWTLAYRELAGLVPAAMPQTSVE